MPLAATLQKLGRSLWALRPHAAALILAPSIPVGLWRLTRLLLAHRQRDNGTAPSETPHLKLVVAAIIEQDGLVLLTRRPPGKPLAGYWEFLGGKVEAGESPEAALQRECREECGIDISVGDILDVNLHLRHPSGDGAYDILLLFYRCRITQGVVQNLDVSDHLWVRPADLHRFQLPPGNQRVVQKLIAAS